MNEQKKPNPVDIHIGSRLKRRRDEQGMSQDTLGAHLGISFQQIQKYEKGTNRLAASRLFEIAEILKTPLAYFLTVCRKAAPAKAGLPRVMRQVTNPGFFPRLRERTSVALSPRLMTRLSASVFSNWSKRSPSSANNPPLGFVTALATARVCRT